MSASAYLKWAPLVAPDRDAERMQKALEALRFTVSRASLSTATDFETAIAAFRQKLKPGDLVIVYFSGHGFLANNQAYIAPADLPDSLKRHELSAAITLEEIEQAFDRYKPGFVLVIADACRVVFELAESDSSEKKSYPNAQRGHGVINSIYAVASRDGTPAQGASATDSLSPFTAGLEQFLSMRGKEFRTMFLDVKKHVLQRTDNTQLPYLHDFATSELYLNPDDSVQAQQRRQWKYLASAGNRTEIAEYLERNPVTRHAFAARAWLAAPQTLNARGATPGSLVSPLAVERAFEEGDGRYPIDRVHSGFFFDREIDLAETANLTFLPSTDLGLTTRAGAPRWRDGRGIVDLLVAHRAGVTTQNFIARTDPSTSAAIASRISAGTRLNFLSSQRTATGVWWLTARLDESPENVYLQIAPLDTADRLQFGSALHEFTAGPVAVGVSDIVDEAPIRAAIARLRREGKEISWVSIATGVATTPDSAAMMKARNRYAKYVIRDMGVGLTSITAVTQSPDVPAGTVRIRVFGFERTIR